MRWVAWRSSPQHCSSSKTTRERWRMPEHQEPVIAGIADPIYVRVREQLRTDILQGVFAPGERIKIAELSKRYGVSQMPVREALQMLQGEGLVTIAPNKGASIR